MGLDKRNRGLVAMSAAVGANCVPCFRWHYNNCLKIGYTASELKEAIELAEIIKGMPLKLFNENAKRIIKEKDESS